jgi:DNA-binding transcriptional regulator YdaS (Cro superfamily)
LLAFPFGLPNNAGMTPAEALAYFGRQVEIARVLGVKPPSVSEWFDAGCIPEGRQYQLELATNGELKADAPANRKANGDHAAAE